MKKVYGYIRVSTAKQGLGVSLQEQKEAINRYAIKHDLTILKWFEELETAAKKGRPLFNKMTKLLKQRKAEGVIIHKIDRSARNLRDWVTIGELFDEGVEIHFAHESLDLHNRGGRLAADIQAVIASDYVRNLREETLKGLYGRLKQGIYPFSAPIGYFNQGSGKVKTIDPVKGPLVKKIYELYASEKYTLRTLIIKARKLGLTNSTGGNLSLNSMSKILNNPFYTGVMKIKGRVFPGKHEPLISSSLYNKVQSILSGKTNIKKTKHYFLFRRIIKCSSCGYSVIGEIQKGHTYYRCHTKSCQTKSIRQERIEGCIEQRLRKININQLEYDMLMKLLQELESNWQIDNTKLEKSIKFRKKQLLSKQDKLTDAYIDNLIDKNVFELKKEKLLIDLKSLGYKEQLTVKSKNDVLDLVKKILELSMSLINSYIMGIIDEKREIIKKVTSNLSIIGRELVFTMKSPFLEIAKTHNSLSGGLERDKPRTCTVHFDDLATNTVKENNQVGSQSDTVHFNKENNNSVEYKSCLKHKKAMKNLLQIIIDYVKENKKEDL